MDDPQNKDETKPKGGKLKKKAEPKQKGILLPSTLSKYMHRNRELEDVTYFEYRSNYEYVTKFEDVPKKYRDKAFKIELNIDDLPETERSIRIPDIDFTEDNKRQFLRKGEKLINYSKLDEDGHVYLRDSPKIVFVPTYIDQAKGEAFYINLLAQHIPFRHLDELLVDCNGDSHETFMQAALSNRLIKRDDKIKKDLKQGKNLISYLNKMGKGKLILSEEEFQMLIYQCALSISKSRQLGASKSLKSLGELLKKEFPNFTQYMPFVLRNDDLVDPVGNKGRLKEQKRDLSYKIIEQLLRKFGTHSNINDLIEELNPEKFKKIIGKAAYNEYRESIQAFHSIYTNRLSKDQKLVVRRILRGMYSKNNRLHHIAAPAGYGKTDLIKNLIKLFRDGLDLDVLVTATTATAARLIDGETVHSAFKIHPLNFQELITPTSYQGGIIRKSDVIIIDECGMLTAENLEKVDSACRKAMAGSKLKHLANQPFGGKTVILFGDMLQLPPVLEEKIPTFQGNKIYKHRHLLESDLFMDNFKWLFLTINHRHKDKEFKEILNKVRLGMKNDEELLNWLKSKVCHTRSAFEAEGSLNPTGEKHKDHQKV
jgi:hypothetical protein